MDEADRAQFETEFMLAAALKRLKPRAIATGLCLECETDLPPPTGKYPALFCSTDCRDMFEKREKMKRINGNA